MKSLVRRLEVTHRIHNNIEERFVKLFDILDFQAKESRPLLKTKEVDRLIGALMIYLRLNPDVLELPYPAEHKRFIAMRLDSLLTEEQKPSYYNGLASLLLELELDSWVLADKLKYIDHNHVSPVTLRRLLTRVQRALADVPPLEDIKACVKHRHSMHMVRQYLDKIGYEPEDCFTLAFDQLHEREKQLEGEE